MTTSSTRYCYWTIQKSYLLFCKNWNFQRKTLNLGWAYTTSTQAERSAQKLLLRKWSKQLVCWRRCLVLSCIYWYGRNWDRKGIFEYMISSVVVKVLMKCFFTKMIINLRRFSYDIEFCSCLSEELYYIWCSVHKVSLLSTASLAAYLIYTITEKRYMPYLRRTLIGSSFFEHFCGERRSWI